MGKKKVGDGGVNADGIPAKWRYLVQWLQDMVYLPEQEIYSILVECNMSDEFALDRLLEIAASQEVGSNQCNEEEFHLFENSSQTTLGSSSQEVGSSSNQNPEISNGGDDHDLAQSGGNNSDETSNVQGTSSHLSDSSTKSGITNTETESVAVSSSVAVPLLSETSSSAVTNVETKRVLKRPIKATRRPPSRLISGERTMAEVLKEALGLSEENVNDPPLQKKPDVTDQLSDSITEPDATRDQLQEPEPVLKKTLGLWEENVNDPPLQKKPDVTDQLSDAITEPNATRDQLQEPEPVVTSLQQLSIENDDPRSSSVNEEEPQNTRDDRGLCTEDEFNSHLAKFQEAYGVEEERDQRAMDYYYPQHNVHSGYHGNAMMNSPYSPQNQNNVYNNMPPQPSAFHQHGGSDNRTYHHQFQASMPPQPSAFHQHGGSNYNRTYHHQFQESMPNPQYRNSHLPQSAHVSPYGFATSRDNSASSRFNGSTSNRFPSVQHQDRNSNEWLLLQGSGTYSLAPPHWIQQSPSSSRSQQQQRQQEQEQEPYRWPDCGRTNPYNSSQDQQNSLSPPHWIQQSPSSSHGQQQQEQEEQPYGWLDYGRTNPNNSSQDQQNSLAPHHWIQQSPSSGHSQQQQQEQEQQLYRLLDYGRTDPYNSYQDQKNSRRDPFDGSQQR